MWVFFLVSNPFPTWFAGLKIEVPAHNTVSEMLSKLEDAPHSEYGVQVDIIREWRGAKKEPRCNSGAIT